MPQRKKRLVPGSTMAKIGKERRFRSKAPRKGERPKHIAHIIDEKLVESVLPELFEQRKAHPDYEAVLGLVSRSANFRIVSAKCNQKTHRAGERIAQNALTNKPIVAKNISRAQYEGVVSKLKQYERAVKQTHEKLKEVSGLLECAAEWYKRYAEQVDEFAKYKRAVKKSNEDEEQEEALELLERARKQTNKVAKKYERAAELYKAAYKRAEEKQQEALELRERAAKRYKQYEASRQRERAAESHKQYAEQVDKLAKYKRAAKLYKAAKKSAEEEQKKALELLERELDGERRSVHMNDSVKMLIDTICLVVIPYLERFKAAYKSWRQQCKGKNAATTKTSKKYM